MCKNRIEDNNEKTMQSFQRYRYPQNRFYGPMFSRRSRANVGVYQ